MKLLIASLLVTTALIATPAHARKDCEELRREIAAKIDAKGVQGYTLEIVPGDAASTAKVVGSCNGGTQRIVYARQPDASTMVAEQPN